MANSKQAGNQDTCKALATLPLLTALNLSACPYLSDSAIACLAPLAPTLTELTLSWCDLHDGQVAQVACLTALTRLEIAGCRSVTQEAILALARNLPRLKTLETNGCGQAAPQFLPDTQNGPAAASSSQRHPVVPSPTALSNNPSRHPDVSRGAIISATVPLASGFKCLWFPSFARLGAGLRRLGGGE
jgi:hypothetical protein